MYVYKDNRLTKANVETLLGVFILDDNDAFNPDALDEYDVELVQSFDEAFKYIKNMSTVNRTFVIHTFAGYEA